jgi:hypothetical protein
MLQAAEKGQSPGSMKDYHPFLKKYTKPVEPQSPQPDQKKNTMPPPKSYAPAGAGFKKLPSNIGLMVQKEALKVFSANPIKKAGKPIDPASALPYRRPAIEGGEGPHAV